MVKEIESYRRDWQNRKLSNEYHIIMIDAIFISVRRESVEKEAVYFVLEVNKKFKRELLGFYYYRMKV